MRSTTTPFADDGSIRARIRGTLTKVRNRIDYWRRPRFAAGAAYVSDLAGKHGLEIGGPSAIFRDERMIPLYERVGRLDGVNFCARTVWHGEQREGYTYEYLEGREKGFQFILEGTDLRGIPSDRYDFVLSSHSLEHIANPIRALKEWTRVMKTGGFLLLVLPHKERTFDRNRQTTTLRHLIADFESGTAEDDLTHLPEILTHHDLALDPPAGDLESFRKRCLNNLSNRCLHHHVFDLRAALELVDHVGLQIVRADTAWPHHIIVLAQKAAVSDNRRFLAADSKVFARSVFDTDRVRPMAGEHSNEREAHGLPA